MNRFAYTGPDLDLLELVGYPASLAELWLRGDGEYTAQDGGITQLYCALSAQDRVDWPELSGRSSIKIYRDSNARFWIK